MMRKLPLLLAFSICSALLLVACGGGGNSNAVSTNTTGGAASNTAPSTAASNTSAAATGDKIGVAECDEYIAKYEACLNSKVPEAMRATYKGAFETARKMWRDAAATPQGKAGLAQACRTALDQAKQAFNSYGCSW